MPAPSYAEPADLVDGGWVETPPSEFAAIRLLRTASGQVRDATAAWIYQADTNGLPLDADLLAAFQTATCQQAAALLALDVDPTAGGVIDAAVESSAGIGTARVTVAGADQAAAARARTIMSLCPDAVRTLRQASINDHVWVAG